MKSLKKYFNLSKGNKNELPFTKLLCVLIMLTVPLCISCRQKKINMIDVPGQNFSILVTEVTQELYESVMGENPSEFRGENNPVENVSWCDAVYFCNKLSEVYGYTPVYSVAGSTDVNTWDYIPHEEDDSIVDKIKRNTTANGFRLPTVEEWEYAAMGGQNYEYAGSNDINEVAWYRENSDEQTHPVALKKANGYGLYDMIGNVDEWCWNPGDSSYTRYSCGGYDIGYYSYYYADNRYDYGIGFRIVRSTGK